MRNRRQGRDAKRLPTIVGRFNIVRVGVIMTRCKPSSTLGRGSIHRIWCISGCTYRGVVSGVLCSWSIVDSESKSANVAVPFPKSTLSRMCGGSRNTVLTCQQPPILITQQQTYPTLLAWTFSVLIPSTRQSQACCHSFFQQRSPCGSKSLHFGYSLAGRERGRLPFWWVLQPLLQSRWGTIYEIRWRQCFNYEECCQDCSFR